MLVIAFPGLRREFIDFPTTYYLCGHEYFTFTKEKHKLLMHDLRLYATAKLV